VQPIQCSHCREPLAPEAAFCPKCGTQAATLVTGPDGVPVGGAADPDGSAEVESRLRAALGPKYVVRRRVGRGGFAEVYEVWDEELHRRLALKVLRPDLAWTDGMLRRFRDEARAVAQLAHPGILPIHFVGEHEGLVYYAMPFVEGRTLADILKASGPLPVRRAVTIAAQVLEALEHAHRRGLVHRDIKPDNVMVDDTTDRAVLVDFGIVKNVAAPGGHTQAGFVVGTPQYMSPEQALGESTVDGRSDVYAMGALLFHLVTGSTPFEGDSSPEIVRQHLSEPPPSATARDPRIPAWLSAAIGKAMAKRPDDRFASADAMRADLVAHHPEEVATAEQPAAPAPAAVGGARSRRHWLVLLPALALAVVALAWWWSVNRPVLEFRNQLVQPVHLVVGGTEVATIAPDSAAHVPLRWRGLTTGQWYVDPPTTAGGTAVGEDLQGSLSLERPRGTVDWTATSRPKMGAFFAPMITNDTGEPLELVINAGLVGAVTCPCRVPPGATRMAVGYYRLFGNSTVLVRDPEGREARFEGFADQVDPVSGSVGLRFREGDLRRPGTLHGVLR